MASVFADKTPCDTVDEDDGQTSILEKTCIVRNIFCILLRTYIGKCLVYILIQNQFVTQPSNSLLDSNNWW